MTDREIKNMSDPRIILSLRKLQEIVPDSGKYRHVLDSVSWNSHETVAIICDMWDDHWCRGASRRVAEMAPRMNEVIHELRNRGVLIIHAPSDTMDFYKDHPGRQLARNAPVVETEVPLQRWVYHDSEKQGPFPVDDKDNGCACEPVCETYKAWSRQIDAIEIADNDAITDSVEAFYLIRQFGIKNVILMGVHTNMCVLGRPFGIRQLVQQGLNVVLMRDMTDTMYNPKMSPWVDHFTGTDLVIWYIEKFWCPTITSDQIIGGKPFRFQEDKREQLPEFRNYVKAPITDGHWRRTSSYVEHTPHPDYCQASEQAHQAFRDIKYGIRIHWGLYSLWNLNGESWPYLGMPYAKKKEYCELYKSFNPKGFDAEEWMCFFKKVGLRCFAFTAKHHEGFSLFDTKTRVKQRINWDKHNGPVIEDCDVSYSVMETPFKRDIVKELCDAAHKHDMKIDLYFSHPDWYDADFRPYNYHPMMTPEAKNILTSGEYEKALEMHKGTTVYGPDPTGEETDRMIRRHRHQLVELLTNYGKIDMLCLDQWLGREVWPQTRETIKMIRKIQPDVMLRNRGIGNYGDYYTPENFVPESKENTDMPWMVIYPLASTFSYDADPGNYKGGGWIVQNLVDAVSKGGSFMVGVGPDADGHWHPSAVENLEDAGQWLQVNGEAIFSTEPREGSLYKEGETVRFTRAKDNSCLYAICLNWPGEKLTLRTVQPKEGSDIYMLGYDLPLKWSYSHDDGLSVEIPASLQEAKNRPCKHTYAFKIQI